ncbi:MAG: Lysine decarboxylase family [uncultured Rubrobacteraceae bacterium]|uniref:Cytokinin riboside 5'-monophosphate phosphoribohydrolase n=1 Tax=uncultured Rubrobacteraceae bacterium TaxID=349277 RepID=A0A6J4QXV6_9ACTN|nr:MAG: Lysine decarboxylase family [uncultured Rubrobacteraceae bacterium]
MNTVCVFCGSSEGLRPSYAAAARRMGKMIARRGLRLVYGGGRVGLMGVLADAALEEGGEVVGVIPEALVTRELAHANLTQLYVVGSMHERKALMADLSDGFVTLPGGYGTLEELLEVLSWAQLSIHEKPCALLDVDGYWEPLAALFDKAVTEGFVRPNHRSLILTGEDPELLLDRMKSYTPPETKKWIEPEER